MASGYSSVKFGRWVYSSLQTLYLIQQVLSVRSLSFKKLDYSILRGIISEKVWTKTKKKSPSQIRAGFCPNIRHKHAGPGVLDPSALNTDDKTSSFCGLFYSQRKKYLVLCGQNIYGRGDDEASSTLLKRLDLCPSGPESTSTTELKNEASFENQISLPKLHGILSIHTHLQIAVGEVCVPY